MDGVLVGWDERGVDIRYDQVLTHSERRAFSLQESIPFHSTALPLAESSGVDQARPQRAPTGCDESLPIQHAAHSKSRPVPAVLPVRSVIQSFPDLLSHFIPAFPHFHYTLKVLLDS